MNQQLKNKENNISFHIILADNQEITAAGIFHFIQSNYPSTSFLEAKNKKELIKNLFSQTNAIIILDYALFDFSSVDELIILQNRFPNSHFLLFSEELTDNFVKQVTYNKNGFSVLLKDCTKDEVDAAMEKIIKGESFICHRIKNHISKKKKQEIDSDKKLTITEKEILKLIASGKSNKDIANERFSSTHTIITHRKNIFRKLEVNNVSEAIKYALRAGIVDASDYYI